ncbi:unnamed protein product [Brassica oleracea]
MLYTLCLCSCSYNATIYQMFRECVHMDMFLECTCGYYYINYEEDWDEQLKGTKVAKKKWPLMFELLETVLR